jgi:peptidoglycan/xylan/chitin deacetylase (PgdA/CDA1 family)
MKTIIFRLIQLFTLSRIFWDKRKHVYLTFDDGPHPEKTPALLEILKQHNAKATFFVIGEKAGMYGELLFKISEAGHTIANHSYSHIRYQNNQVEFMKNIEQCESVLAQNKIKSKRLVRIPYGTVNMKLFGGLLLRGYRIAFWNKDTKDYNLKTPHEVTTYLNLDGIQDGDVVLMHDYPDVTPDILTKILSSHPDLKFLPL